MKYKRFFDKKNIKKCFLLNKLSDTKRLNNKHIKQKIMKFQRIIIEKIIIKIVIK